MARSAKVSTNMKVAKRSLKAKHKPTDKTSQHPRPRQTVPPINEKAILHVGPVLDRRFPWEKWDLASTVTHKLHAILDDPSTRPDENIYMYLTTETRKKGVLVPVMVAVKSACPPTTHIALTSIQTQTEEFSTMDDNGLIWARLSKNVFRLTSSKPLDHHTLEYMNPYLLREAESPEPIDAVTTIWKGEEIIWSPTNDSVDDAVNEIITEDFPTWKGDEIAIKTRLTEQHNLLETAARGKAESKANVFANMVDRLSCASGLATTDVRQSLRDMKVYKIYPDHPELEPEVHAFGTHPFKNAFINRYVGNANEFC